MRKYILTAVALMAVTGINAQDVWEMADSETATVVDSKKEKPQKKTAVSKDAKYLKGAVTEKDGKVAWTLGLDCKGMSAQQVFEKISKIFKDISKTDNQLAGSGVSVVNKKDFIVASTMYEWLVFANKFLALDRAKFQYTLIAKCSDGHLDVSMERLSYRYAEGNGGKEVKYLAEDAINDKNALNKKQTRLIPGWAKFRRKTVDRKDELFQLIAEKMKQ